VTTQPPRRNAARWGAGGLRYLVALVVTLIFALPILASALRSFLDTPGSFRPFPDVLNHLVVDNYATVLNYGPGLASYAGNSVIVALATAAGCAVIASLAGYALARMPFVGSGLVFVLMLTPLMVPYQGILAPIFLVLSALHLTNSLLGLILVYLVFQMPFSIFIMRNTFSVIPQDIEDAAVVDGASTVSMLSRVMLPLAIPGVITVVLYAFLFGWNEFLAALIVMADNTKYTLPVALQNVQTGVFGKVDFGVLQAGSVIAMLPSIIVFLVLQRYYTRGLIAGSVKG
jgi:multiple sugar transport system permease protein